MDVLEEILPAQNHSFKLGLKLRLPHHEVEAIHSTHSDPKDCLLHVIIECFRKAEPRPTWRVIVDALRSPAVNLTSLANEVEAAHFPDTTSTPSTSSTSTGTCHALASSFFPDFLFQTVLMPLSVNSVQQSQKRRRGSAECPAVKRSCIHLCVV